MKILMTCDAVGGVWQYANDLAAALAGAGVEVILAVLGPISLSPSGERVPTLALSRSKVGKGQWDAAGESRSPSPVLAFGSATLSPEGEREVQVIPTNLPLDWLAPDADTVLHAGRAIAALAVEHEVDLVHLNSPALAAAGPFPVPMIAVAHGCVGTWFDALGEDVPADLAWHADLVRGGLHAADALIAPSASYAATVQRRYGLPIGPHVVHNGRASVGLYASGPADHVFTAGRLWDRVKNTALLDATAALLSVPFRAAGPTTAPQGERVTADHLQLLGTLDAGALAAEYAQAPIFVSAARFEPFGLAVLEAAQAGCPLVLAGIDTFRELWTGAALLVGDDDPSAYAAAIERIRSEPGLRRHLSEAAQARAARYTPAAMAAGTLAVYRDLLAQPERRAA